MFQIADHVLAQMFFRQEDDVIETFLGNGFHEAFAVRVHIRGSDAGPHGALAQYRGGTQSIFAIVIENPVFPPRKWMAVHGGVAHSWGVPRIRGMNGDPQQMDSAGVMFDSDEDEGVDDLAEQANGHLDEVGTQHALDFRGGISPESIGATISGIPPQFLRVHPGVTLDDYRNFRIHIGTFRRMAGNSALPMNEMERSLLNKWLDNEINRIYGVLP